MASSDQRLHACPDKAELRRYHARELSEHEEAAIREHLDVCAACAQRVAEALAEHDTWVERIRAAGPPPRQLVGGPARGDVRLGRDDIAGYEILEEIRRGGQGIVFRGYQKSTKREVALKVLREGPYASDAARRRFEREIELAAALNHARIVTVFDSGETADGRKYFVMDFVRGQPLDRFLATRSLALADKLTLFSKIGQAVNYAHQRGVMHRDLKPSNILVDDAGEPHILDFGLARPVAERDATMTTTTGQVAGTLPYMSPEQARGQPDGVDVRSDVYALGVMLYELLTGAFPYPVEGDTLEVLKHIAETPPTPPSRVWQRATGTGSPRLRTAARRKRLDDELDTIVLKALRKEREHRYQTAGELARDIDHYVAGEPIEAKRDSGWYMLKKTLYRYRVGVAVAAAFVATVTISAVALGAMYANQVRLRAEAERQAELARAAEAKAGERFEHVRDLAGAFLFNVDPLISHLPGSAPARQWIVGKGLEYLELLTADAAADPRHQLFLAGAYVTIGDVQGGPDASSLGDVRGALRSYQRAAEILESVATAEPENVAALDTMMLNLIKIGDAYKGLGDRAAALASFRKAVELGQHILETYPRRQSVRGNLSSAHERMGLALQEQGEIDSALGQFQNALQITEELTAGKTTDLWIQRSLAVAHLHVAEIRYSQGQLDDALDGYREFLKRAEDLLAAYPRNIVARHDVAVAHQWIGIILADMGQHGAAIKSFHKSVGVLEDWLRDDPQDEAAQSELATTCLKLGESQLATAEGEQARDSFQRAVELTDALAQRQPERPDILQLKADACHQMAKLHLACARDEAPARAERVERWQAARDWLQRTLAVLTELRQRGMLAPSDVGLLAEIAAEIESSAAAIDALTTSDSEAGGISP
jgi:tetratricopeptide (TPR) repeat protein/tRNA A-37 threonylcarbamoyl transferase component Bud32